MTGVHETSVSLWQRGRSPKWKNLPIHLIFIQAQGDHQWDSFESVEADKKAVTMNLRAIQEEFFQQCMDWWKSSLNSSGITLKVNNVICFSGLKLIICDTSPLTFLTNLVNHRISGFRFCFCFGGYWVKSDIVT